MATAAPQPVCRAPSNSASCSAIQGSSSRTRTYGASGSTEANT
ncbi:hypothetical protein ACQPZ8_09435 [Actinomadura nitritigenes]